MEYEAGSPSTDSSSTPSALGPAGLEMLQRAKARHQRLLTTRQASVAAVSPWLPVALLTALCVLIDFALPPLAIFDGTKAYQEWGTAIGGIAMTAALGFVPAQVVLLGLIVACSPTPLWRRLLVLAGQLSLIAVAIMLGQWLYLTLENYPIDDGARRDALILVATLPSIALLCSLPFWFTRLAMGWELTRQSGPATPDDVFDDEVSYQQSPAIRHVVTGVAVTIGCLCLLLLAPSAEHSFAPPPFAQALILGTVGCVLSLVLGLPLILFFTRVRWRWLRWGIPISVAILIAGIAYVTAFSNSYEWDRAAQARFVAGQATFFFVGGVGGLWFGLAVFRWFGWTIRPVLTPITY